MIERPPYSKLLGPLVLFSGIVIGLTMVVLPVSRLFVTMSDSEYHMLLGVAWFIAATAGCVFSLYSLKYLAKSGLVDRIVYTLSALVFLILFLFVLLGVLPP
jgi:hypothetical protein